MRICFVGLDDDLALRVENTEGIGGEAVQHALLAHAFRQHGPEVSMIVRDRGQEDGHVIDGIRIFTTCKDGAGIKGVRFFYPRITSWWSAMARANADVYYQSPAGMLTGLTALFCRMHRRFFVFRLASDVNCIPGEQLIRFKRDKKIYEWGLRSADLIAAQTNKQIRLLRENYGLPAQLVPMVCDIPDAIDKKASCDIDALWVSNIRPAKRPDVFLDLAAQIPDANFVMIGGASPGSEDLYQAIRNRAGTMANVEFLGFRPNAEVNAFLKRSKVFVNTSLIEGFPNTFLQAWVRGVPVVTFFDPDKVISDQQLGVSVTSLQELENALRQLLVHPERRRELGIRARRFVIKNHQADAVIMRYLELIKAARAPVPEGI